MSTAAPVACPDCKKRRDNFQAAGLVVFVISLLTCGMLMGITYPLTVFLLYMSTRKCPACRVKQPARTAESDTPPQIALSNETPEADVDPSNETQSVAPTPDSVKV